MLHIPTFQTPKKWLWDKLERVSTLYIIPHYSHKEDLARDAKVVESVNGFCYALNHFHYGVRICKPRRGLHNGLCYLIKGNTLAETKI